MPDDDLARLEALSRNFIEECVDELRKDTLHVTGESIEEDLRGALRDLITLEDMSLIEVANVLNMVQALANNLAICLRAGLLFRFGEKDA